MIQKAIESRMARHKRRQDLHSTNKLPVAKTQASINGGGVVFYEAPDGGVQLDVRLEKETVWLSLDQMTRLFRRDKSVISRHLRNVFVSKELDWKATVAKNATVQMEGGREVIRQIEYFNLDAILSVGYRVNSKRGTQFRIWATRTLRDHLSRVHSQRKKASGKRAK